MEENIDDCQQEHIDGIKKESIDAVFAKLLEDEIHRLDCESTKHKELFRQLQLYLLVLSASTSIVAGSALVWQPNTRIIEFAVLVLSTVSSSLAAWLAIRRPRELWQHEREIYYALRDIRREFKLCSAVTPNDAKRIESLLVRVNAVLGSSGPKWRNIHDPKSSQVDPTSGPSAQH